MLGGRASDRDLERLCRRMATSLESGIDLRKILEREVQGRSSGAMRRAMEEIQNEVLSGVPLGNAFYARGEFFPQLMREMIEIGEETGQLHEIFRRLADYFENRLKTRRIFLGAIAWPMLQLFAALTIIGIVIVIPEMLPRQLDGKLIDILGLGIVGIRGLVMYFAVLGLIVAGFMGVLFAMRRGLFWAAPLQRLITSLPVFGTCLQTLAVGRLAWSLGLTLNTSMDLRKSLPLALRATANARYTAHEQQIVDDLQSGYDIHEALAKTAAFPVDFLDVVEVGETSGKLPDTMQHLARQYEDRGRRAMATITMLAGFAVWGVIALLIVLMIFQIFFNMYLKPLNEALKGI